MDGWGGRSNGEMVMEERVMGVFLIREIPVRVFAGVERWWVGWCLGDGGFDGGNRGGRHGLSIDVGGFEEEEEEEEDVILELLC